MDIKVGDLVTYKSSGEIRIASIIDDKDIDNIQEDIKNKNIEILKIERPHYEVVEEKKELLTKEEKEFLKQVLKFMDIKILYISIDKQVVSNRKKIHFSQNEDGSGLGYWYYIKNSYFNRLEDNKVYTLQELGLEESQMCKYCGNKQYTIRISVDKWNEKEKEFEPYNNFEINYCPICR